ncbi:GAF domain-containing protein [Williamsia sp.]|uniref:sensor histidine kinase n=1 Tax=Williamsia sp. TaxID=1872085 RepID=UPI001A225F0C|nr:GAF domain-containing protein [Williamsia sp.]MBJ7287933.1 GAF domain-containing protein [Williamsia sp.]
MPPVEYPKSIAREPIRPPHETRTQIEGLLEAITVVAAGLNVNDTLGSIVSSAMSLVDAQYGALGVDGESHNFVRFIHRGMDVATVGEIGYPPTGLGVLGLFHNEAHSGPLRLDDISKDPSSIGFPAGHPPMTTFLGAPISVRGTTYGTIYLTEKRGGYPFTEEDETIIHALAAAAGIAIENAKLFEQAQSRLAWIEANRDVATELLSGTDTADALAMVARRARSLTGSDMTFVALPDGDALTEASNLVVRVASGHRAHEADGQVIPIDGSTTGAAFRSRTSSRERALAFDATANLATRFGPAVVAPMCVGDDVRGVLVGLRKEGGSAYTEETVGLLSSFADQAALAMSMADAATRLRDLDILAERDRIARDLHDHVIQRIFAAGLSLQSTAQRTQTPDVKRRLTSTIDDLQDVIQDIRSAIFDLHGSQAATNRLRESLHSVIDELSDGQPIHFSVRLSGPLAVVDATVAEHVIAVVREAVSNAVRHSGGTRGVVAVTVANELTVTVSDNGSGIPDGVSHSGLGNLGSRARECGGELVVRSPLPGGGTEIVWTVPIA